METTGRFWPRLSVKRIQANDCRTLPFDVTTVYAALIEFENYPKWWPAYLRLRVLATTADLVGSRFEVHPTGGSFVCEVAQVVTEKELVIQYVDGLHRGTGIRTLESAPDGTRLCYRIDLEPQGLLPRFLSHFMDFAGMHSRGMQRLFDWLEAWLRARRHDGA